MKNIISATKIGDLEKSLGREFSYSRNDFVDERHEAMQAAKFWNNYTSWRVAGFIALLTGFLLVWLWQ